MLEMGPVFHWPLQLTTGLVGQILHLGFRHIYKWMRSSTLLRHATSKPSRSVRFHIDSVCLLQPEVATQSGVLAEDVRIGHSKALSL